MFDWVRYTPQRLDVPQEGETDLDGVATPRVEPSTTASSDKGGQSGHSSGPILERRPDRNWRDLTHTAEILLASAAADDERRRLATTQRINRSRFSLIAFAAGAASSAAVAAVVVFFFLSGHPDVDRAKRQGEFTDLASVKLGPASPDTIGVPPTDQLTREKHDVASAEIDAGASLPSYPEQKSAPNRPPLWEATRGPADRIVATLRPRSDTNHTTRKSESGPTSQAAIGPFKMDAHEPIVVEANSLAMAPDGGRIIFTGDVYAEQGNLFLRTTELTAVHSGPGHVTADHREAVPVGGATQLTRLEARRHVLLTSKAGPSISADWASFHLRAYTALLGGNVVAMRGNDLAEGQRLRIDLSTGTYDFEQKAEPSLKDRPPSEAPTARAPASRFLGNFFGFRPPP